MFKGQLTTRKATLLDAILIFVISLECCFLLWQVYPYGITTSETAGYAARGNPLNLFSPHWDDWWRLPTYGLFLRFTLLFSEPSMAVYWGQAALFSFNIALVYLLGIHLLSSRVKGAGLALGLLAVEVFTMRTFFSNVVIFADVAFGHLIFTGIMLILISWQTQSRVAMYAGYSVLGVASFIKQSGLALFPIWVLAPMVQVWLLKRRDAGLTLRQAVTCICLLVGLTAFWTVRNGTLYGVYKPSPFGGHELLAEVLPYVEDGDQIFEDNEKNTAFMTQLRSFEEVRGANHMAYAWNWTGEPPGPLEFLGKPSGSLGAGDARNVQVFFELESVFMETALRIIQLHLGEYVLRTWNSYYGLFGTNLPLHVSQHEFHTDVVHAYDVRNSGGDWMYGFFYPNGVDYGRVNATLSAVFDACCQRSRFSSITLLSTHRGALLHVLYALCLLGALVAKGKLRVISLYIVLMFTTVMSLFAITSITQPALARYALAGEMLIHLMQLLSVVALGMLVSSWAKQHRWHYSVSPTRPLVASPGLARQSLGVTLSFLALCGSVAIFSSDRVEGSLITNTNTRDGILIVDNAAAEVVGNWEHRVGEGYQKDYLVGQGEDHRLQYYHSNIPAGRYDVYIRWQPIENGESLGLVWHAKDGERRGERVFNVDTSQAPCGIVGDNVSWQRLGSAHYLQDNGESHIRAYSDGRLVSVDATLLLRKDIERVEQDCSDE